MMMLAMMTMMMTGCVGWRMMVGRRGRGQLLAHFGAPARNPAPAAHTNASNTAHTHTHTIQAACTHFGTDAFNALFILLPTALMNYVHTQILNATSPCWIAVKNRGSITRQQRSFKVYLFTHLCSAYSRSSSITFMFSIWWTSARWARVRSGWVYEGCLEFLGPRGPLGTPSSVRPFVRPSAPKI